MVRKKELGKIPYPAIAWIVSFFVMAAASASGQDILRGLAGSRGSESAGQSSLVSLDALLKEMVSANPDLQAARKRWEATQKRPGQAGALPDPKVRFGWSSAGALYPGAGLGSDPSANIGIEVSQEFPFPGKRALRGSLARQQAQAESYLYRGEELSLAALLKSSFYELQYDYDAIDVLDRYKAVLQRLAKVAEDRYATGLAAQQDVIKSQIELSLVQARLIEFERNKRRAAAAINALLNRDVSDALGRPEPPGEIPQLAPLEVLKTSALQDSPLLRARRADVDGRRTSLELSRRDYYPDFEVMGGYFNMGAMKDMWEFRVQINVPVFFARKQRLGVEEAGARLSEAQMTYRAGEQSIRARLEDQYLVAENSRRLMELYSKLIVPQATLALESALNSYRTGSLDFLSVLSNFSAILENEMKYYENRSQLLQAQAYIQELTGKS